MFEIDLAIASRLPNDFRRSVAFDSNFRSTSAWRSYHHATQTNSAGTSGPGSANLRRIAPAKRHIASANWLGRFRRETSRAEGLSE
jgi:hypothetical protein